MEEFTLQFRIGFTMQVRLLTLLPFFLGLFSVRKWIKLFAIRINQKYYSQKQNENGMR